MDRKTEATEGRARNAKKPGAPPSRHAFVDETDAMHDAALAEIKARGEDPKQILSAMASMKAKLREQYLAPAPRAIPDDALVMPNFNDDPSAWDMGNAIFFEESVAAGIPTPGGDSLGRATEISDLMKGFDPSGKLLFTIKCFPAASNLARETGIPSRTIASLLLSLREGRIKLDGKTIVFLDEAGMVGSREFDLLQSQAVEAGAKLVCVGDPKQLQPIDAGGIFRSLMEKHGKAEISNIQRQRTDFEPLLKWLDARAAKPFGGIDPSQAAALRLAPEDCRMQAIEEICSRDEKLSRAFSRWRSRFDFQWLRDAVEMLAKGEAAGALELLDSKGRLRLERGPQAAMDALISAWDADKTKVEAKTMVAATRVEVAELNRLARQRLIERGIVLDAMGMEATIIHRDDTTDIKRFAQGDRIVFTMNDRGLGVANGVAGTVKAMLTRGGAPRMIVELDDANERGEKQVCVPMSFGRFDHAWCLTNFKSQGRTFDSAYVLANPSMADREWTYVAASRSRFATTIFVNTAALGLVDPESHRDEDMAPKGRQAAIDALASRMRRSRAKGTALDYDDAPIGGPERESPEAEPTWSLPMALAALRRRLTPTREAERARA